MITPTRASSLQNFLRNLHSTSFISILFTGSLILFITIPLEPLTVPYVLFISSAGVFVLVLPSIYYLGFSPLVVRPVIFLIRSTSMNMGLSNHKIPPCTNSNNFLMQLFMWLAHQKWGLCTKSTIPVLYKPIIHYFGSSIATHVTPIPFLYMYTCGSNSWNLSLSVMSWPQYLIFSTHPTILGRIVTPSRMHGSVIMTSSRLHYDICTDCFMFPFLVAVDGSASWHASKSSSPIKYSTCTCLYFFGVGFVTSSCIGSTYALGMSDSILPWSSPFFCCNFPRPNYEQWGFFLQYLNTHSSSLAHVLRMMLG